MKTPEDEQLLNDILGGDELSRFRDATLARSLDAMRHIARATSPAIPDRNNSDAVFVACYRLAFPTASPGTFRHRSCSRACVKSQQG